MQEGGLQPGQPDFAAEMRSKAQAKRKAAAPAAVPVSTGLAPWVTALFWGSGRGVALHDTAQEESQCT